MSRYRNLRQISYFWADYYDRLLFIVRRLLCRPGIDPTVKPCVRVRLVNLSSDQRQVARPRPFFDCLFSWERLRAYNNDFPSQYTRLTTVQQWLMHKATPIENRQQQRDRSRKKKFSRSLQRPMSGPVASCPSCKQ